MLGQRTARTGSAYGWERESRSREGGADGRRKGVVAQGTLKRGDRYTGQHQGWERLREGGGSGEEEQNESQERQAVKLLLLLRGKARASKGRKAVFGFAESI